MNRVTSEVRQESLARLRELLPPGATVYSIIRRRSRSGACRWIDLYTIPAVAVDAHEIDEREGLLIQPRPIYLSGYAWNVGCGEGKHPADQPGGGLKVSGGGMDMAYATVYHLAGLLYPHDPRALRSEVL